VNCINIDEVEPMGSPMGSQFARADKFLEN
jgi:hypothetical protein